MTAAELADDKVLKEELIRKLDLHALNQTRFQLPSRVVSKRFIFKLLYGATAFGYSVDSDFLEVGFSQNRWQEVIDEFYDKYRGIGKWHAQLLQTCRESGRIEIPSGRVFQFAPELSRGLPKWPLTKIKNYPVQGFGADLVMLARIEFFKLFLESGLEGYFVGTIHDSLVLDSPTKNVYNICTLLKNAVESVPDLCRREWNYDFSLPLTCEIQVGKNKKDMEEFQFN